jgi:hypothetical protein
LKAWCLVTGDGVGLVGALVPGEVSRSSDDGGSDAAHREDLDVPDAAFVRPDLTTFCRLDELGLEVEHLRGSALGFRNLTNYIARSLLETGGFRARLHPRL